MKRLIIVLIILSLSVNMISAELYTVDYSKQINTGVAGAQFLIQTLKYDPYPVNPGEWFDVWIKVENVGNEDALNTRFELVPDYPFSSTDNLVREYGRINGNKGKEEESNQVVLKYRVKVADNAPEGNSDLEFRTTSGNIGAGETIKKLPIVIGKTKTDFDIVMQGADPTKVDFTVTNIGEGLANSVIVKINDSNWLSISGDHSFNIGNLKEGDSVRFDVYGRLNKNIGNVNLEISYTDSAGTRRSLNKSVGVIPISNEDITINPDKPYLKWTFGLIGIIFGILITIISRKIHHKKRIGV